MKTRRWRTSQKPRRRLPVVFELSVSKFKRSDKVHYNPIPVDNKLSTALCTLHYCSVLIWLSWVGVFRYTGLHNKGEKVHQTRINLLTKLTKMNPDFYSVTMEIILPCQIIYGIDNLFTIRPTTQTWVVGEPTGTFWSVNSVVAKFF